MAYGLTPPGLAAQLNCSVEEGKEMIDSWYRAYPDVKDWKENLVVNSERRAEETASNAYVTTLRGRARLLEHLASKKSAELVSQMSRKQRQTENKLEETHRLQRALAR